MSATASRPSADSAILRARRSEDVVVGDEIVRHRLATRAIHWTVALFFFLALFSGLPIWTPVFGWMAHLFGGLNVCRWLHPWAGILFFASAAVMFVHWLADMRLEPSDREWLRPRKIAAYMKHQDDGTEGVNPDPRRDLHLLRGRHRLPYLPRHGGGAGNLPLDDPGHGQQAVGAAASPSLVSRSAGWGIPPSLKAPSRPHSRSALRARSSSRAGP
jgi:hypothetical protein